MLVSVLPIVFIFILYQFLIAKPQRETRQAHEEMLKNLKNGDKIITTGGIYGTVKEVKEKVVQVRIAEDVTINVARNAIASLQEPINTKESEKK